MHHVSEDSDSAQAGDIHTSHWQPLPRITSSFAFENLGFSQIGNP